ncbi:MAG TPA: TetR/AcrR family transcriptional regulator [Acidimicrobiales bacterium]
MAAADPPTRDRILTAAAELMRRHGYAGTGIKAILSAARAPYGSLYHHFPGGKEEVGVETIRQGGRVYLDLVEAYLGGDGDLVAATLALFDDAADFVESTDFADACPIGTIAGEVASTSDPMRRAAADAFASWLAVIEDRLTAAGVAAGPARAVAVELFCAIEGAFLLARTTRDAEPLRTVGRAAAARVAQVLAEAGTAAAGVVGTGTTVGTGARVGARAATPGLTRG